MNDMAVGKNGIGPPPLAPARIFRPGDPGFPADVGESVSASKFRNCQHPGCGMRYLPSVPGMRYCLTHNTPEAERTRAAGMTYTPQAERPKPKLKEPAVADPHVTTKTRQCFICRREYVPSGNRQKRCPTCAGRKLPPTREAASPPPGKEEVREVPPTPAASALPPAVPITALVTTDLRAIAAAYRLAADLIEQAAALVAPPT